MKIFLKAITIVPLIIACFWAFNNIKKVSDYYFPAKACSTIIYYSVGTFDTRFGITQKDFIADLKKAETVWEKASAKNLFEYSATGTLKVNFIYDNRQKVTDELKKQGIAIDNYKATYDTLKIRFDAATASLEKQKAIFKSEGQSFEVRQADYNEQVGYWNDQGGAPKKEFNVLQEEKNSLALLANKLNSEQDDINSLVNDINGLVSLLNNVAQKLNNKVETFNTIGSSNGEEFSEGEYIRDGNGARINIYQFDSQNKLIRVLEHELGHAIGLGHVTVPDSIMYRLNNSNNISLTTADVAELNTVCEK